MADAALVGVGARARATNAATAPAFPTGLQTNDLLIIFDAVSSATATNAPTPGTPAGWTQKATYGENSTTNNRRLRITWFYAYWTSGMAVPSVSYTGSANDDHISRMIAIRGGPTSGDPTDFLGTGSFPAAATGTAGPITGGAAATNGGFVLVGAARDNDFTDAAPGWQALTGDGLTWTVLENFGSDSGLDFLAAGVSGAPFSTALTVTSKTFTISGNTTNGRSIGQMWAIKGGAIAPTVDGGADATIVAGATFTRTATEDNGGAAISSRSWRIVAGPAGVNTTISTAAALSWTPSTTGTYTLRYSATNSVGTGTDDVTVTVNPPAPTVNAGADAIVTTGTAFSRTASETGSGITARTWKIQSGPTGVGTTIGTAAALSWTPTTPGQYVLRYTATNVTGSGVDDVLVKASVVFSANPKARGVATANVRRVRAKLSGSAVGRGRVIAPTRLRRSQPFDLPPKIVSRCVATGNVRKIRTLSGAPMAHGNIGTVNLEYVSIMKAVYAYMRGRVIKATVTRTRANRFDSDFSAAGVMHRVTRLRAAAVASKFTGTARLKRVCKAKGNAVGRGRTIPPTRLRRSSKVVRATPVVFRGRLDAAYIDRVFILDASNPEAKFTGRPAKVRVVRRYYDYTLIANLIFRERARRLVETTGWAKGVVRLAKSRNVGRLRAYVTASYDADASIRLGPPRQLALARFRATGDLDRLGVIPYRLTAQFRARTRVRSVHRLTNIVRVISEEVI